MNPRRSCISERRPAWTLAAAVIFVWLCAGRMPALAAGNAATGAVNVAAEYFYEPGCAECFAIDAEIIPDMEERYKGFLDFKRRDLGRDENYARFSSYVEKLKLTDNAHVYFVLDGEETFAGLSAIREGLFRSIDLRVARRLSGEAPAASGAGARAEENGPAQVRRRVAEFTLVGIVLAGLADGVNPCAISTMIFLMSVLSLSRAKTGNLWLVGGVFCLATFITYTAIGFGFLRALYVLSGFVTARRIVDFLLVILLLGLAYLSFRDAIRYRRTGEAADMVLRMPEKLRQLTHRLIRDRLGRGTVVGSAFVVGGAVTVLESVCTGQLYVPALAIVVRSGLDAGRGMVLLLVYNVMFVVPLAAVLVAVVRGARWMDLLGVTRRGVTAEKVALGLLFLILAAAAVVLSLWPVQAFGIWGAARHSP